MNVINKRICLYVLSLFFKHAKNLRKNNVANHFYAIYDSCKDLPRHKIARDKFIVS